MKVMCVCVMQAMKVVSDRQTREAAEKQLKETELSRVKINKEDIDLIVSGENWFSTCGLSWLLFTVNHVYFASMKFSRIEKNHEFFEMAHHISLGRVYQHFRNVIVNNNTPLYDRNFR